jgi:hypothetical protein
MGTPIPPIPPTGCLSCLDGLPGSVHVWAIHPTYGYHSGNIPKIGLGVYFGLIHGDFTNWHVWVGFCQDINDTGWFISVVFGDGAIYGAGCDNFGGNTASGCSFFVTL